MTDLITNSETATIETLTVEIKFYLGQASQSILEVGKRLIQAKEMLPHGQWQAWLKDNFNLSYTVATRFMQIAERFSNVATSQHLSQSQMIEMLSLPAGDEQKFIDEKIAEGKAVADMTIKQLRAEINDWKQQAEDAKNNSAAEIERLEVIQSSLKNSLDDTRKNIDKLIVEKNLLEKQLKEKEKPEVITVEVEKEVLPIDYAETKSKILDLSAELSAKETEIKKSQSQVEDLQSQLDKATKEIKKLQTIVKAKENIAAQFQNEKQIARLKIGDGINFQPDEPYKLLLTDPPYSTDVDDIDDFAKSWLPNALYHVRDDGFAYVFIGAYPAELKAYLNIATPEHINLIQVLVWTYRNTLGNNPKDRYKLNYQACLFYRGVNAPQLDCPITNEQWAVQDINAPDGRIGDRYHSWQKPMEIAERFIRHSTKKDDSVFDPFACTGTFLLAAANLGRKAYGFEINPDNAQIAFKRGCQNGW